MTLIRYGLLRPVLANLNSAQTQNHSDMIALVSTDSKIILPDQGLNPGPTNNTDEIRESEPLSQATIVIFTDLL
jgi:hypothetical protein